MDPTSTTTERGSEPSPAPGRPRLRRLGRGFAVLAVALIGGWLGLLLGGRANTSLGPLDVTMSLHPSLLGDTVLEIPPLGTIAIDSHDGPLGLTVRVDSIDADRARTIFSDPRTIDALSVRIPMEIRSGVTVLVVRALVAGTAGAALLGWVALRPRRRSLAAGSVALATLLAGGGVAWATLNVNAVQQPQYTGLVANAPALLGDAKTIAANIEDYRKGLAALITNVSKLYDVTSALPAYTPSEDVIRVLHISDLHDNPTSWAVIASVIDQFDIDAVVDTGDIVHQGTALENKYVEPIGTLGVPYVYVRGNHDSSSTAAAVAAQPNAVVLDDDFATVAGLRFVGVADPRFTPDKTINDFGSEEAAKAGAAMADQMRAEGETADVAVMHNPAGAKEFDGLAPYILCGHMHTRAREALPDGSLLFQQGSTGGAGINALKRETPTPVTLTVFYFSKADRTLQAWDDITLGGLGLSSATIERHLTATFTDEEAPPPPEVSANPSESAQPTESTEPPGSTDSTGPTEPTGSIPSPTATLVSTEPR